MASTQSWETVGKSTKKGKNQGQAPSKAQKRALADNMPRIEVAPPVKESPTIYDAFIEKANKAERLAAKEQAKPNGDAANHNVTKSKPAQPKKKPQGDKKKEKAMSLSDAFKELDPAELETMLAKDQATFPDNPSVWLKDLASMLNLKLDKVPDPDPVFEGKPKDYPASELPSKVRKILVSTLNQCSEKVLELFLEHCIQSMVNDIGKSISTHGYRIFIQLVAFDKSEIVIDHLPKYLEMLKTHQNRPLRCLSIMWAVGQAGNKSLANGLKVWLEVMLPVLNMRALSTYAVDYLESLFKIHSNLKSGYNVIGFRNFFPILDLIFGPSPNLPTNLQKKLATLYPKLRAISFGSEPDVTLRNFFPSFLARLSQNSSKALRQEVLSCLVECLSVDKHSFSLWRQMYTKHLTQSSLLLQHFVDNWDSVCGRLDKKVLRETIRGFNITNEELGNKGGGDGYDKCVSACKELLVKMSSMRFPWRLFVLLILAAFAAIVSYDIYISHGFKKSRTAKFLQDTGLLVFFEQVWNRIRIYTGKAISWLQENVPHYYAKVCAFCGPYLKMFWEKIYAAGVYIELVTRPHREWLNRKIPEFLEWVNSKVPWLWSSCSHYLNLVWEYVVFASLWTWHHLVSITHTTGTWLQENVFTGNLSGENLQKTLSSSMASVQSYSKSFITWCTQLWAGKTN